MVRDAIDDREVIACVLARFPVHCGTNSKIRLGIQWNGGGRWDKTTSGHRETFSFRPWAPDSLLNYLIIWDQDSRSENPGGPHGTVVVPTPHPKSSLIRGMCGGPKICSQLQI